MLDKIDTLREELEIRRRHNRARIRKDIKSLGLKAHVSSSDYKITLFFNSSEDMHLYKIAGQYKEGKLIIFTVVTERY
jgi:hypothetical protein